MFISDRVMKNFESIQYYKRYKNNTSYFISKKNKVDIISSASEIFVEKYNWIAFSPKEAMGR